MARRGTDEWRLGTGRPVIGRSRKALDRDIATLQRLRRSIASDARLNAEAAGNTVLLIDRLVTELLRLNISA